MLMKMIGVIPARYDSVRFPGKLLEKISGIPVIVHTYNNVKKMNLLDEVIVATEHEKISQSLKEFNIPFIITSSYHESGTDRIAEAIKNIPCEVVINIQGDEPFLPKEGLEKIYKAFKNDEKKEIQVASLMTPLVNEEEISNPNNVKVICKKNNEALYFSRSVIPFNRSGKGNQYFKHLGVYAFRKKTLLEFVNLPKSDLEETEKLEQLRLLENNYSIKMFTTQQSSIGIDTPEDLEKAIKFYQENHA
ncbi:3-deoxy-manno-octulosonate cytidylyltransferase [Candidatus Ornithobacterium hominis]|uniref:3-deoxy-manno-octulosonate cytidylyltransferase n=2 Tax=Candidatus Ornithobacterium hominis TaxID=2497989 RepID=A0A383TW36_9FLAO|nr:3-deoxy-manno-octulosonate cytidylyltransferase [Candidatus Ornithobacterium hominis]